LFEFKAWLENRSDPALVQLTYRDQKTKYRRLEGPVYSLSATGGRKRSPERLPLSRLRTLGVDHECSALSILGPEPDTSRADSVRGAAGWHRLADRAP